MTEYSHARLNDLIEKYKNGTISDEDRFQLEKQALDDPFLFDALEGYALHLQKNENKNPAARIFTLPRIGIAASLIFLIAVVFNLRTDDGESAQKNERISMVMEGEKPETGDQVILNGEDVEKEQSASTTTKPAMPKQEITERVDELSHTDLKNANLTKKKTAKRQVIPVQEKENEATEYITSKEKLDVEKDGLKMKPKLDEVVVLNDTEVIAEEGVRDELKVVVDKKSDVEISNAATFEADDTAQGNVISPLTPPQSAEKRKKQEGTDLNASLAYYEAVPVIGKAIFDDYARQRIDERGLRQPKPQKVVIEFTIDENGQLTNFKHIFSGCSECGPFAISILQNSGEWKTVPPGFSGRARYTFMF